MASPRLRLFVSSRRGLETLAAAHDSGITIDHVVADWDETRDEAYDDIRHLAALHSIPCYLKEAPPGGDFTHTLAAGWRRMISRPENVVVLHDSLLPFYRGFAPVVTSLLNAERQFGVTAFLADDSGYDRGPILKQHGFMLAEEHHGEFPTIAAVLADMLALYASLTHWVCELIQGGHDLRAHATPQDEEVASYSIWRDAADHRIDWSQTAEAIVRMVAALGYPYGGAQALVSWAGQEGLFMTIREATVMPPMVFERRDVGKVAYLDEGRPVVICGAGMLRIDDALVTATGTPMIPWQRLRARLT